MQVSFLFDYNLGNSILIETGIIIFNYRWITQRTRRSLRKTLHSLCENSSLSCIEYSIINPQKITGLDHLSQIAIESFSCIRLYHFYLIYSLCRNRNRCLRLLN